MSSLFFSPISKVQNDSVVINKDSQNYCISKSAVKRTKWAARAVSLDSPSSETVGTPLSKIDLQDEYVTPVHMLRTPTHPDTPKPYKIRTVGVYVTPIKL